MDNVLLLMVIQKFNVFGDDLIIFHVWLHDFSGDFVISWFL